MGLLAPLYALAALAIAGPIILHLIRRQPQGQMQFSSLMFLSPSPPRLTRRSRLDNLWLLLLRALAVVLIAIAFARPYMRQDSFLNNALSGRRIVMLLDTSGSMQRAEVWTGANEAADDLLDSLSPQDHVSLYTIDDQLTTVLAIDDSSNSDGAASQQATRAALQSLKPTWNPTALGNGLKSIVDLLTSAAIAGKVDPTAKNEVVLITDLHSGCQLETLQGFPWPENIQLDVRHVHPAVPGNARVSLMQTAEDEPDEEESVFRVRVENDSDSKAQILSLNWAGSAGPLAEGTTTIQVPPGQIRVVPLVARPPRSDRISLTGDAWDADNAAFVADPVVAVERIVFCGGPAEKTEDDLAYFLEQAPLGTELVRREIIRVKPEELAVILSEPETKGVVLEPLAALAEQTDSLKRFARDGGVVIVCLSREVTDAPQVAKWLGSLLDVIDLQIIEAPTREFALLSRIDFQHPVFAPLADPRFNDFGKLRFWSHRQVTFPKEAPLKVVAAFDDNNPLLLERQLDMGRMWVLSAGWQPTASGLALSSKFIPIMMSLLDPNGRTRKKQLIYEVGERIDASEFGDLHVADSQGQPLDAGQYELSEDVLTFRKPGLFWLEGGQVRRQVAIQVPAAESRLTPLDIALFEQYGVTLGKVASDAQRRESLRQLQVNELESKQRLWQWLISGCILVLAVETFLAGWLHRR